MATSKTKLNVYVYEKPSGAYLRTEADSLESAINFMIPYLGDNFFLDEEKITIYAYPTRIETIILSINMAKTKSSIKGPTGSRGSNG